MKIDIYIVDAFCEKRFKGNPAAVCILDKWLDDDIMQKIAMENNLSETAFIKRNKDSYDLRWFTPEYEIDLCGHATLASAYIIFNKLDKDINNIRFNTKSGEIYVYRVEDMIKLNFPIREGERISVDERIIEALGIIPIDVYKNRDLMIVLRDEEDIKYLQPNFDILKTLGFDGIVVTAKGTKVDFVSRYFIPNSVINEDPVTGSSHCTLVPYWAKRLKKTELVAKQLSKRGGKLYCKLNNDIIEISGKATIYMEGTIYV